MPRVRPAVKHAMVVVFATGTDEELDEAVAAIQERIAPFSSQRVDHPIVVGFVAQHLEPRVASEAPLSDIEREVFFQHLRTPPPVVRAPDDDDAGDPDHNRSA